MASLSGRGALVAQGHSAARSSLKAKTPRFAALAACLVLAPHSHAARLGARFQARSRPSVCEEQVQGSRAVGARGGGVHTAGSLSLFVAPAIFPGPRHAAQGRLQLCHITSASSVLPKRRLRVGSASLLHVRCLNRLLIDPWEVKEDGPGKIAVVLPAEDGRVKVSSSFVWRLSRAAQGRSA
jgi:hypothetical protein